MEGWLVILILGILLGVLSAGIMRRAASTRAPLTPELRRCPHCATLLKSDARLCHSCLNVVLPAGARRPRPGGRVRTRPAHERGRRGRFDGDPAERPGTRDRSGA
jgi:hypothetical protein